MPCLLTTPREQGGSLLNPRLLQLLILECVSNALLKGIPEGEKPKEALSSLKKLAGSLWAESQQVLDIEPGDRTLFSVSPSSPHPAMQTAHGRPLSPGPTGLLG